MTLILSGTDGLSDVDGSAATPAIRGTDANTGIFFGADIIGFAEGGAEVARFNADAQFVAAAGTASLPVITTTGDTNTGIFFPAADTIAFSEGGVEAMRIDASGNLLLATTANNLLWFNDTTFGNRFLIEQNGAPALASYVTQGLVRNTNDAESAILAFGKSRGTTAGSATVVSSGDSLGVISFQGADGTNLVEAARITGAVDGTPGANDMPGRLVFSTTADGASTTTERARIDSSGVVKINRTTNSSQASNAILQVLMSNSNNVAAFENSNATPFGIDMYYSGAAPNNTSSVFYSASDTGGIRFSVRSNGGIANYTANNSPLSDRRLKKNITPAGSYLDKICAIPVVTYFYNDQTDDLPNLGVIAQDVQLAAPELCNEEGWGTKAEDGSTYLGIWETDIQYALMKSIQELKAIVDAQAVEIAALKGTA